MQITIATQNELLEGLAAGREDDDSVDFSKCTDAADTGRREALIVLNNYFVRKTKEERDAAATRASVASEIPTLQTQDMRQPKPSAIPMSRTQDRPVQQADPSPQPVQRWDTMATLHDNPSPSAYKPQKSKLFSFSRSSTLVVEPQPQQTTRSVPVSIQSEIPSISPALSRTKTWGTQASNVTRRDNPRRTSSPQRRSTSITATNRSRSPVSNVTSLDSSFRSSGLYEPSIGLPSITSYGGCCKYAHYLRDGKVKQSLQRQSLAMFSGAVNVNYRCRSTKCTFQIPAWESRKDGWNINKRPQSWRGTLQYTHIYLAKSHVPMLAPLIEQRAKAQYCCLICVLSHEQAGIFYGVDALLEHVVGHAGREMGDLKLEGPLSFSNEGASVDSDFDINLPDATPAAMQLPMAKRISDPVAAVELQHQPGKFKKPSRTSSHASQVSHVSGITDGSQETDPYHNPW